MSFRSWREGPNAGRIQAAEAKRNRRALRLRYAVLRGGFGIRAQLDMARRYAELSSPTAAMAFYFMSRRDKRRWFARQEALP